jgi:hypothetical protein
MGVKKYHIKTQSGSVYELEEETRFVGAPLWKIINKEGTFYVLGLLSSSKFLFFNTKTKIITADKILKKEQFYKNSLFIDKSPAALEINKKYGSNALLYTKRTSPVIEITEVK